MYDANDLINTVKKIAIEAVSALKPVNIVYGKVISISPLKIQIEQKLTLTKEQIVLSRNVTNYKTNLSGKLSTEETTIKTKELESDLNHSHELNINNSFTISNSLKKNDEVILLRMQEGQKYIVLDRIGG